MKKYSTAKELRAKARGRLKNRWGIAILAFLIACAFGIMGYSMNMNFASRSTSTEDTTEIDESIFLEEAIGIDGEIYEDEYMLEEDHEAYIFDAAYFVIVASMIGMIVLLVVMVCSLLSIFVGAPLQTGYMRFNLRLFKTKRDVSLNNMLYGFKNCYGHSAGTYFLMGLVYIGIALRTLLVPLALLLTGIWMRSAFIMLLCVIAFSISMIAWSVSMIAAQLRYSMCFYILADHPEMTAREVLRESKRLMNGNRWRLLRLRLSFLGWVFLSIFTLGIGLLWVGPYMQAAETAFYRELVNGGKKQSFLESLFHND